MNDLYGFEKVDDWHYVWFADDSEILDVYIVGDVYILRHECDLDATSFKFTYDELLKYLNDTFAYLHEDDEEL